MSEGLPAWAQLVSTTDTESEPISINIETFTIGRAKDCDLCIDDNKLVSSRHCFIQRDSATQLTYLQDTSTNGTLLNMKRKIHRQRVDLAHGDEFHLVHRAEDVSSNSAFLFQDLAELCKEEELESTLEDSNSDVAGQTLAYDVMIDDCDKVNNKEQREASTKSDERHGVKRSSDTLELFDEKNGVKKSKRLLPTLSARKEGASTSVIDTKPISASTSQSEKAAGNFSKEMNKMEESLICIICQEIFHDCVSAQPCMHSFCASCYSDWMSLSREYPSCRTIVARIGRNHMVNNLVEAYLAANPDKKRSPEELKEMDSKNKITKEMLDLPVKRALEIPYVEDNDDDDEDYNNEEDRHHFNEDDYNEEDENDDDNDGEDDYEFENGEDAGDVEGLHHQGPPRAFCRQCPGYEATVKLKTSWGPAPSTSASHSSVSKDGAGCSMSVATPVVVAPEFVCKEVQTHILCGCCVLPMPHRQEEIDRGGQIPQQRCSFCFQPYCNLYWGCQGVGCRGCLFASFQDMKVGREVLTTLVLKNQYESEVLKNYLDGVGKTVEDLIEECMERFTSGRYTCSNPDIPRQHRAACYVCCRKILSELAYQYMLDIPRDQLPVNFTSRPLCHWGRNCRTQQNKPAHAVTFSHLGEQTRWA